MDLVTREAVGGEVYHTAMSHEVTGHEATAHENEEGDTREYTCPMHPEVVRNEPGSYPICGMDLEQRATEGDATNKDGRHQAGTDHAVEIDPGPAFGEHDEPGGAQYTCPRHPEIVRPEPGRCPIRRMEVVEREASVREMHRDVTAAGVHAGEERTGHAGGTDHAAHAGAADGEAGTSANAEHSPMTAAGGHEEMEHGLHAGSERDRATTVVCR